MTLDESIQDDDEVIKIEDGLTVLVDRVLHANLGAVHVSFVEGKGIEVTANKD